MWGVDLVEYGYIYTGVLNIQGCIGTYPGASRGINCPLTGLPMEIRVNILAPESLLVFSASRTGSVLNAVHWPSIELRYTYLYTHRHT